MGMYVHSDLKPLARCLSSNPNGMNIRIFNPNNICAAVQRVGLQPLAHCLWQ